MKAVESVIKTVEGLVNILKASGFIDGESLTSIDEVDEILFWHALAKNGGGSKETYLVWNVMPSSVDGAKADDRTFYRRCYGLIDIFTRQSLTDVFIQELMKRISDEALAKKWSCEMYDVPSFEPDFKRTRLTLQISTTL